MDVKLAVCRLCLRILKVDECQALDNVSKDIIKQVIPQVDLNISPDPKLCQTCYKTMLKCYTFKCNYKKYNSSNALKKKTVQDADCLDIQNDPLEKRCDFCLENINEAAVTEFDIYFNEVLQTCLPDLDITVRPVPCKKCVEALTSYFTFIGTSSDTEDKLKNFACTQLPKSDEKLNLYEAVQFILATGRAGTQTDQNSQAEEVKIKIERADGIYENLATNGSKQYKEASSSTDSNTGTSLNGNTNSLLSTTRKRKIETNLATVPTKNVKVTERKSVTQKSVGIQVNVASCVEVRSIGIQVNLDPIESNDSKTPPRTEAKKKQRHKPGILRRAKANK